jgi:hypothetical protein
MAETPNDFRFLGRLREVRVIARGRGLRVRRYLVGRYGGRNWRKLKGIARVEAADGYVGDAEIHWYEAHGVGAVLWKIKRPIDT